MKKYANILAQPHVIHVDKIHIQIDNNSIIDFEPSSPIRLRKVEFKKKQHQNYREIYEIHYLIGGEYHTVAYLNHQMRIHPQISKIAMTSKAIYHNWHSLLSTILTRLNINDNYRVANIEIAIDTNADLLKRYYSMLDKKQIILNSGYVNPAYIEDANNRFTNNTEGDTLYIHKLNKKGQIVHFNKTRVEDKQNQLKKVKKPHIVTKLSKVIDTSVPHYRLEQLVNLLDYSDATRNVIYVGIDDEISEHKYKQLDEYDRCSYSKGSKQISFDSIRIGDLNDPHYLLRLFKYFAKFNLEFYLGCNPIAPLTFPIERKIKHKNYITTNIAGVFWDTWNT